MTALGKIEAASSWADLRNVFEKALAAETTFDDGIYAEAIRRKKDDGTVVDDRLTDLSDMLTDVRVDAEEAMALTPAPDLTATLFKIEYARKRWQHCDDWPDEWWAAVLSDLRRFAGAETAVSFVANGWLARSGVSKPTEWRQAEGWYRSLADVEIEGMPEEVRSAVDHAICLTMNHLVEAAPATDVDALILKMEIARDCSEAGLPSHWWDILQEDVSRLVSRSPARCQVSELDRLIAAYTEAEKALDATRGRGLPDGNPMELRFLATLADLDAYEPQSPDEFVRAIAARFSGDAPPTNEMAKDLVATAQRLSTAIVDGANREGAA